MLRHVLICAVLSVVILPVVGCGDPEMKDFHLTIIGEMEKFEELDTWTPVKAGSAKEDVAAAERALKEHYADLMDLVRPKSVVALSRWCEGTMSGYASVPKLTEVKLTPIAENEDKTRLLLAGVWEELPKEAPVISRRLMIYPIYERGEKKVSHMTVTIRGEKAE